MNVLETCDLAVGWNGRAVVKGVNLSLLPRTRLALLGENGSGKTTLLRALAGLLRPLSGSIRWRGGLLPRGRERLRALSVLFQGERAAPFTVSELVTLGLGLDGPPSQKDEEQVRHALSRMQLHGVAARPCTTVSGGEWQRVLLARALVPAPGLLLLDEPTNHLDPARRAALLAHLDELAGSVAVILCTHDLDLAARADRVALVARGAIVFEGRPADVLTPEILGDALGVRVQRVSDPEGGPPLLRVLGPARKELA
jgi:iron complex transport system ATP-binding protein